MGPIHPVWGPGNLIFCLSFNALLASQSATTADQNLLQSSRGLLTTELFRTESSARLSSVDAGGVQQPEHQASPRLVAHGLDWDANAAKTPLLQQKRPEAPKARSAAGCASVMNKWGSRGSNSAKANYEFAAFTRLLDPRVITDLPQGTDGC